MGHQSSTHPFRPVRLHVWIALAVLLPVISSGQTITTITPAVLPSAVVFDASGDLYVAETGNHRIRKVDPQGHITTFAGTGTQGFSGDNGLATDAQLDSPQGLALTAATLYIADTHNHRIRRIDLTTNIITTIAGTGASGFAGDTGLAIAATLNLPTALALDAQANLYLADTANHRIRRVAAATGVITTVAGNGTQGYSGDAGQALDAAIDSPNGLAIDTLGNLYLADTHNHRIRKIDATTNIITTLAGTGALGTSLDGASATAARLALPQGLTIDASGNVYLADTANHRILRIDATTHTLTTIAGTGTQGSSGDTGTAAAAMLDSPRAAALSPTAQLTLADTHNQRVRQVSVSGTLAPTATVLSVLDPSATPITLTTRSTSTSSGILTGSITILDASSQIATSTLSADGATTIVLPTLNPGTHTFTATYSGDRNFQSSSSAPVVLTIPPTTVPTADFTLIASAPNAQTIPAGTSATFSFVTQTQGSLSSAISLAVAGLPQGATATFKPTYLPPGPASSTFTLTVTTLKPSAASTAALLLPAGLAALFLAFRRGKSWTQLGTIPVLLAFTLVSLMTMTATGCGARIRKADTQAAAPASYTITVTGTATSPAGIALVHTAAVNLTLQ